jgi:hypothetical protein
MKQFGLFTKSGKSEAIHKIEASDMEEAVIRFSNMKDLSIDSTLEIFDIREIKKNKKEGK